MITYHATFNDLSAAFGLLFSAVYWLLYIQAFMHIALRHMYGMDNVFRALSENFIVDLMMYSC
jgi:hypothetical protein